MLTLPTSPPVVLLAPSPGSGFIPQLAARALRSVAGWAERRRQLRALSDLDDHLLGDIGLSHADVEHACSRPFWALKSLEAQRPNAR
ncbi:MAG TPA: DUF1127 domain-containing protein [Beijerinckiaceae bacterium]|nr:DUF1127 domain-containing protein [Beijerinckiaceae bacterium]